ncbi:MAG: hypothetical protein M3467_12085 [Actinomycetota bacterium]|nr:hypothetical protein [Actinomycetota bacterium]
MTTTWTIAVAVAGLLLAGVAGVVALLRRAAPLALLGLSAAVEAVVLAAVGACVVGLLTGHRPASTATLIGYLIGAPLVLPFAAAVAVEERTRWGTAALTAGGVAVAVLAARLHQVWQPALPAAGL